MIQTIQLLLTLTLLVFVHELGHFMWAKIFGARVDKFYLFFNPFFSLCKFRKGETEYGIGWVPLGGYCKIAGMVDESMDTESLSSEPQPWEYRSKPLWQRMLIITGGVINNFIAAIVIYAAMSFCWGKTYLPLQNLEYGIYCDSTALSMGLQNGDKILQVDDKTPKTLADAFSMILLDNAQKVVVDRKGKTVEVAIPTDIGKQIIAKPNSYFITEFVPFIVDSVMPNTPADKADLHTGDKIIAIDTIATPAFPDFLQVVQRYKGKSVQLTIVRHGYEEKVPITISEEGKIGAWATPASEMFEVKTETYSLLQSVPEGVKMGINTMVFYVKQFKLVFTKEGSQQVGSFVSMGKLYDDTWNWRSFWSLAALFSVILAFMNILPIPGLDGGHLLFLLYELVARKKPSDSFLEKAQMIGMAIIFAIFFYALVLDFTRL